MKPVSGQRIVTDSIPGYSGPLEGFAAVAADAVEALTAAIFLRDSTGDQLVVVAFHSNSDKFISDAKLSISNSVVGQIFSRGLPVHQPYIEGDLSALGIYHSGAGPIMAYMAAPVGTKGLLWLDTRKAYCFSGRHLRILLELAATAERILDITERSSGLNRRDQELELLQSLLPPNWQVNDPEADFFDKMVQLLKEKIRLDGALVATTLAEKDLCQVTASAGFSPILTKDRPVRIRQGWVKWALEHDSAVIISGTRGDENALTIFHSGESVGFETRSLAVVPWAGPDDSAKGVLVLASKKANPLLEQGRPTWQFLGSLSGLVRTVAYRDRLLQGVRKYDGESGLPSEGYFRHLTRLSLAREREKKGNLVLLLVLIVNMDELYLAHDHFTVRRFLETFSDKLLLLTKRKCFSGKFTTGGFGLLIENIPSDEIRGIMKKAESIMGSGTSVVEGTHFYYEVDFASAHYPDDCADIHGLWATALERLTKKNGPA